MRGRVGSNCVGKHDARRLAQGVRARGRTKNRTDVELDRELSSQAHRIGEHLPEGRPSRFAPRNSQNVRRRRAKHAQSFRVSAKRQCRQGWRNPVCPAGADGLIQAPAWPPGGTDASRVREARIFVHGFASRCLATSRSAPRCAASACLLPPLVRHRDALSRPQPPSRAIPDGPRPASAVRPVLATKHRTKKLRSTVMKAFLTASRSLSAVPQVHLETYANTTSQTPHKPVNWCERVEVV